MTPADPHLTLTPAESILLLDQREEALRRERLTDLVGTPGPSGELVRAASEYAVRVAAAVAEDPELAGYVEQLESAADAEDPPTGEDLARDFERYLREDVVAAEEPLR